VVRAFVQLRQAISEHKELSRKISLLEKKLLGHDQQIQVVMQAIEQLMSPEPLPRKRRIGFDQDE